MVTFEVGNRYCNRDGEYEVLNIQGNSMRVRFDSGEELALTISIQANIYENIQQERIPIKRQSTALKPQTQQFYWSMGFLLARKAALLAFIPPHALDAFKDKFYDATGRELSENEKGIVVHLPETDKRWYECRITFRAKPSELYLLPLGLSCHEPVEASQDHSLWNINDNKLFFALLEFGFATGPKQDRAKIENNITAQYLASFSEGYSKGEHQ